MREIKFRGKDIDCNEWRYGSLVKVRENDGYLLYYIVDEENQQWIVLPETVGQYTGLKDKNGKKIYEGDIVKVTDDNDEISELNSDTGIGAIEWLDKWGFWNISRIENSLGDINNSYDIEVIGNIYENPELLEVV